MEQSNLVRHQRGVVLVILLTIIVLALTTALVTTKSTNLLRADRLVASGNALERTREALIGYALRQPIPGSLPCPDTTGDGLANPAGAACSAQLGLVPFQTLGIDVLTDATGATLWYAVSLEHIAAAATLKNSSLVSTLTLDGDSVAGVIIAPGPALDSQGRVSLQRTDFLEGVNADGNLADYDSVVSATQNDQLVAVTSDELWHLVELQATEAAATLLNLYRTNCGEYPWAAAFSGTPDSVATLQSGLLPLGTALPFDWGAVCGLSTAPAVDSWLATHWQDQLYYRMCTVIQGNCVTVLNASGSPSAGALVGPGAPLSTQSRPSASLNDYYEDENSDANDAGFRTDVSFYYTAAFNDVVRTLP